MLRISGFDIKTTPEGELYLVEALSPNVRPTISPNGMVEIVSSRNGFSWKGKLEDAVRVLKTLHASTISLPHFRLDDDKRLVLVVKGIKIDPLKNNTGWWLSLVGENFGLPRDEVVREFRQSLQDRPWQTSKNGKQGNGRPPAKETVEEAMG